MCLCLCYRSLLRLQPRRRQLVLLGLLLRLRRAQPLLRLAHLHQRPLHSLLQPPRRTELPHPSPWQDSARLPTLLPSRHQLLSLASARRPLQLRLQLLRLRVRSSPRRLSSLPALERRLPLMPRPRSPRRVGSSEFRRLRHAARLQGGSKPPAASALPSFGGFGTSPATQGAARSLLLRLLL